MRRWTVLAISYDEISAMKPLGKTIKCWVCGQRHKVRLGQIRNAQGEWEESSKLAFFKCGKQVYLCGIDGKEWRPKNER